MDKVVDKLLLQEVVVMSSLVHLIVEVSFDAHGSSNLVHRIVEGGVVSPVHSHI